MLGVSARGYGFWLGPVSGSGVGLGLELGVVLGLGLVLGRS